MNPLLSFIDVDDLVEAIVAMLGDTSREHRTYFVCHPSSTDQRTLWRALGTTLGRDVVVVPVPKTVLYGLMRLGVSRQLDEKQYKQLGAWCVATTSETEQRKLIRTRSLAVVI